MLEPFLKLMLSETTDLLSFVVATMEPLADPGTLSPPTIKEKKITPKLSPDIAATAR